MAAVAETLQCTYTTCTMGNLLSLTNPVRVVVEADKCWNNGKVIHQRVQINPRHEVIC